MFLGKHDVWYVYILMKYGTICVCQSMHPQWQKDGCFFVVSVEHVEQFGAFLKLK